MLDGEAMGTATVKLHHRLAPEDQARADFYALIARLFADPPDAGLLAAIAQAAPLPAMLPGGGAEPMPPCLPRAWDALRAASAATPPEAAAEEYNDLFVGVGKSEVNLHASHWLTGFMLEKPLVEVRAALARLGLARQEGANLLEDHLAALCETMRILIAGSTDRSPSTIAEQRAFYERHLEPWVSACCTAIRAHPVANYYGRVAQFTEYFMALERDSFAID